MSMKVVSIETK